MAYFEQTRISDSTGTVINPAEKQTLYTASPPNDSAAPVVRTAPGSVDDQVVLLRRIVKLLESQAATDPQQRQRMTIDNIAGSLTLGTVSTVTGVTTVSTVTTVSNMTTLAGYDQRLYSDWARTSYNTGIRAQLTFS